MSTKVYNVFSREKKGSKVLSKIHYCVLRCVCVCVCVCLFADAKRRYNINDVSEFDKDTFCENEPSATLYTGYEVLLILMDLGLPK